MKARKSKRDPIDAKLGKLVDALHDLANLAVTVVSAAEDIRDELRKRAAAKAKR